MQVEKAPIVVKSGLKKEEAEELMSKLTAGELSSCAVHTYHFWMRWCLLREVQR